MLSFLEGKLTAIAGTLGLMLLLTTLVLWARLSMVESDRDSLKSKLALIKSESKAAIKENKARSESHDYAMKEVVKYYDGKLNEVAEFKRGDNETECNAANRLFRNTKY